MTRSVICVSHQAGAGGRELATAVAESLGYRYVDEEVMAHAAEIERVPVEELVDVERRKSFFSRLMIDFGRSGGAMYGAVGVPAELVTGLATPDRLRNAIRAAIEQRLLTDNRFQLDGVPVALTLLSITVPSPELTGYGVPALRIDLHKASDDRPRAVGVEWGQWEGGIGRGGSVDWQGRRYVVRPVVAAHPPAATDSLVDGDEAQCHLALRFGQIVLLQNQCPLCVEDPLVADDPLLVE